MIDEATGEDGHVEALTKTKILDIGQYGNGAGGKLGEHLGRVIHRSRPQPPFKKLAREAASAAPQFEDLSTARQLLPYWLKLAQVR